MSFRARPFENTSIEYKYYLVQDREDQGGYTQQLEVQSLWNHGWRFVTDLNQLSSLTFQLAFAGTYTEAINSDIRSAVFLTNNFHGFSLNVDSLNDKSFLQISPENSVVLRSAPEVSFSSVEQAPWRNLPVYFSFSTFTGAVHRDGELSSPLRILWRAPICPTKVTIPIISAIGSESPPRPHSAQPIMAIPSTPPALFPAIPSSAIPVNSGWNCGPLRWSGILTGRELATATSTPSSRWLHTAMSPA